MNDCSPEITFPLWKLRGGSLRSRTCLDCGEAEVRWEETGKRTSGNGRGMGPSTWTRNMEITSGRTTCQQGLAATCEDSPTKATTVGGERHLVRRMSQYERQRRGNARPGGLEVAPEEVTPLTGKGALGKWRASDGDIARTLSRTSDVNRRWCRAGGITFHPRGVCERALEPPGVWEGPLGKLLLPTELGKSDRS